MIVIEYVKPIMYIRGLAISLTVFGLAMMGCRTSQNLTPDSSILENLSLSDSEPLGQPARVTPISDNFAFGSYLLDSFVSQGNVQDALPRFIAAERIAIAERNLGKLRALWAPNAQIIDQRGTENTEDDYIWRNRRAILDRYEVAVFRFSPPLIEPPMDLHLSCSEPKIDVNDKQPAKNRRPDTNPHDNLFCLENEIADGTVVSASREGDRWQFIHQQGRWWILSLRYN